MRMLLAAMIGLMLGSAALACEFPTQTVDIPDGSAASQEDMVAAQGRVKAYVAEMDAYLACLEAEAKTLGEEITETQEYVHNQRHNSAVEAMEQVAEEFNVAVRAFKAQ